MKDPRRLKPEQRLRRQSSFKTLVEKGNFARGTFFYIWAIARAALGEASGEKASIGIVVNKKALPRATDRNLVKRRVREIFRLRQSGLKTDVAILVKFREGKKIPGTRDAERDLEELFKKAGATP